MPFTGKATYSAGTNLPELAEDVSDLVAINSPHETPLLDALGDAMRPARSTIHEWLEDALLPNSDRVDDDSFTNALTDTTLVVENPDRFRAGDQLRLGGSGEVMLVTAVDEGTSTLTVVRGYGGTTAEALEDDLDIAILGNAALEGADAPAVRFTSRSRKTNYTQIFSASVEVSGSELAVRQLGVADELDWQKQQRSRELLRDLENCVLNGRAAAANPEGSASVRRSMRGIVSFITTHRFAPGVDGFANSQDLLEDQIATALREVWSTGNGNVDLMVVGGRQKREINNFVLTNRRYRADDEAFKNLVSTYESDYGVLRIVMSRWVPPGTVLLLDSSRISVMPLAGRSFHFKKLAATGDRESGQVIGEYTLELRNENAHSVITGLNA